MASDTNIRVIPTKESEIIFITDQKDSILISTKKLNSIEPVIFFRKESGPYITNLKDFSKTKLFFFPDQIEKEPSAITNDLKEDIFIDLEDSIQMTERSSIIDYKTLKSNYLDTISLTRRSRDLQESQTIELSNRSEFYPIINYNQYLDIRFDNDFWDYTDYYYTNGLALSYMHPFITRSPLSYLLVSNGKNGADYYGLTLVQHMYTGFQPKVDTIVEGDRPWAAYTTLGQSLISFDRKNKIRHYSEINFGILGPFSGGGFIQDIVHTVLPNNSPPEGWHNQIAQDYILDYQYEIKSLLYETSLFESYIIAGAQLGTLRDNLQWGFGGKFGKFIPFYHDISIYNRNRSSADFSKKLRFNFLLEVETQLIAYDATLQGGLTNKTSIYVLPSSQINRFVMEGKAGLDISYGNWQLQFIQYWKSKEFKTGKDHKYVSLRLKLAF